MRANTRPSSASVTHERLKQVLRYDPDTGVFIWISVSKHSLLGKPAGVIDHYGHRVIRIDWVLYRAARLAWFYVHGRWPERDIDHINGQYGDDRISNLREATASQNIANQKKNVRNTSGFKGAHFNKALGKFTAHITKNGKHYHLGVFKTAEEAHHAYMVKARVLHGEFARSE